MVTIIWKLQSLRTTGWFLHTARTHRLHIVDHQQQYVSAQQHGLRNPLAHFSPLSAYEM
jgi:hypothetical protein